MLPDHAAIRLAAEAFEMPAPHVFSIDEQVGSYAPKERAPFVHRKSCARAELFELAHDCRFSNQGRTQPANHFEQKIVGDLSFISFKVFG